MGKPLSTHNALTLLRAVTYAKCTQKMLGHTHSILNSATLAIAPTSLDENPKGMREQLCT